MLVAETLSTGGLFDLFSQSSMIIAVGVLARITGVLFSGGLRMFPGGTVHLRIALLLVLGLAAAPVAISVSQLQGVTEQAFVPMVFSELLVGCCLGITVSFFVSVFESSGSLLASVAGLNWADVFTPGGSGGPGVARLCGWVGLASFVAAGGQQLVVAGLIDSFLQLPVGALAQSSDLFGLPIVMRLIELPSLCLQMALMIAAPLLVAVMTAHLTATICMRSVDTTPGPGVLQGIAAAVMLGGLIVGSQQWAGNSGEYLRVPFEATFELSDPVIDQAALSSFEKEGQANE
ncbi:flagellar biosynthetic protein FliR [Pirellulales bacterium]|nr:flagellar biosynthetic protein FliR [Pirellulales bacterium]MDB4475284.1 flagellar biosynthetic protein FliR [Pirellulales bacterium]MDB4556950.1 flagellar biosynthetic protein FliR [bacterium]MDC1301612.1 flagellar biosynthetic protein FliR [bacterium]